MAGRLLTIYFPFEMALFFEDMLVFRGVWHPWKSNWMRNLKWFQVWFRFHVELWGETIKWSFQTWAVNHWYADEHSHILIKTHEVLSACQPLILLMVQKSQGQPPGMYRISTTFPSTAGCHHRLEDDRRLWICYVVIVPWRVYFTCMNGWFLW